MTLLLFFLKNIPLKKVVNKFKPTFHPGKCTVHSFIDELYILNSDICYCANENEKDIMVFLTNQYQKIIACLKGHHHLVIYTFSSGIKDLKAIYSKLTTNRITHDKLLPIFSKAHSWIIFNHGVYVGRIYWLRSGTDRTILQSFLQQHRR